jgi:hypothetical protein
MPEEFSNGREAQAASHRYAGKAVSEKRRPTSIPNRSRTVLDRTPHFKRNSGGRVIFGWNCTLQDATSQASHISALRLIASGKWCRSAAGRFGTMRVAPSVGPLTIKIVWMVGGTAHLAASPSFALSAAPEGQPYQCRRRVKCAIQLCGVRRRCDRSSLVDPTRLGTSQPSGSDDRMPEEHSEKSNHNNPKDKTPRVATEGLVVGGQPVGIAHAKLLGRPPASQPH